MQLVIAAGLFLSLGFASSNSLWAQSPRWISSEKIQSANAGVVPEPVIQIVLKPVVDADRPGQVIEFHTMTMTRGKVEMEIFSSMKSGHRYFKVIGGNQGEISPIAREGQQRVRFFNAFNDDALIIVIRDVESGKTARILMSAKNLDRPVAVLWKASTVVRDPSKSPVRCEWVRAISDNCDIIGYGVMGSCLLNLVTCTVTECVTEGC